MKKTVGFGDFLLRLSPPGYRRFSQAQAFETYYTGAEANVCASLAVMGEKSAFVTRVPENPIAETGLGELRRLGVDVSGIVRGGDRLGIYYVEKGASQRPSKVVYDRMHSGVTEAKRGDFAWPRLLKGAGFFHFTGITPALGGELPLIVEDACRAAGKAGARISCDLNYRKNLWDTKTASKVMTRLLKYVDHLIANEEDAEKVLGIQAADSDVTGGKLSREGVPEPEDRRDHPQAVDIGVGQRLGRDALRERQGVFLARLQHPRRGPRRRRRQLRRRASVCARTLPRAAGGGRVRGGGELLEAFHRA